MPNDLEERVQQYQTLSLPGQPMMTHMGTSYLINDLWREVQKLRAANAFHNVTEFHKKFGINYEGKPRALDFETLQFRLKFMREELREYEDHMDKALFELDKLTRAPQFQTGEFAFDEANFVHHLSQALDALVDLEYVVLGTGHLHGFDMIEAHARVHRANMAKARNPEAADDVQQRKMKIVKPEGWEPPRHEDLVEDHAHKR